ncbi:MAG: nickel pincer cofactor biosynthesis protein LarB [Deltaproteobacteria bacterium]|jgi:NCAIR mutase (PurE)-related protein|nr:nickel pincer cofactor biosynthesis protein LarB [Deltaproteobacteria bacterium]
MTSDLPTPGILFDHARRARIGLPEAVFCQGKPMENLRELFHSFGRGKDRPILFTRLEPEVFGALEEQVRELYDYDPVSRTAWGEKLPLSPLKARVAIVSGGTADASVAREAARTLEYLGFTATLFEDSGVAGLWRLAGALEEINRHQVVIVVAGLDAALASVLGGLTPRPVIAVPTSVGYGLARHGESALASMLVSCSPGVSVENIDNGYGAACAAARILNLMAAEAGIGLPGTGGGPDPHGDALPKPGRTRGPKAGQV